MSHNSLANYYQVNFNLLQHHKYSLEEIENMIPFERTIYVQMLSAWIEEENDRIRQQQQQQKGH
jgi:hypothetical protein